MKNNKGINMIALVVTIIVMIIIASISLNAAIKDRQKAEEAKRLSERNQVEKAVGIRYANHVRNSAHYPIIGASIPEQYTTADEIKEYIVDLFTREEVSSNLNEFSDDLDEFINTNLKYMEYTRILRHSDVIGLEIENVTLKSVFIVNYYTGKVLGPIS